MPKKDLATHKRSNQVKTIQKRSFLSVVSLDSYGFILLKRFGLSFRIKCIHISHSPNFTVHSFLKPQPSSTSKKKPIHKVICRIIYIQSSITSTKIIWWAIRNLTNNTKTKIREHPQTWAWFSNWLWYFVTQITALKGGRRCLHDSPTTLEEYSTCK